MLSPNVDIIRADASDCLLGSHAVAFSKRNVSHREKILIMLIA